MGSVTAIGLFQIGSLLLNDTARFSIHEEVTKGHPSPRQSSDPGLKNMEM